MPRVRLCGTASTPVFLPKSPDTISCDTRHVSVRPKSQSDCASFENKLYCYAYRHPIFREKRFMSILDCIGNTLLAPLDRIDPNPKVRLFAKLEGDRPRRVGEGPHRLVHGQVRGETHKRIDHPRGHLQRRDADLPWSARPGAIRSSSCLSAWSGEKCWRGLRR